MMNRTNENNRGLQNEARKEGSDMIKLHSSNMDVPFFNIIEN